MSTFMLYLSQALLFSIDGRSSRWQPAERSLMSARECKMVEGASNGVLFEPRSEKTQWIYAELLNHATYLHIEFVRRISAVYTAGQVLFTDI